MTKERKIKVFISHAVANEPIAHKLVDLLVGGVGLRSQEVFCSSLPGHSISTGKGFVDKILSALLEADVVMTVLTSNYYESIFCIAELGGCWDYSAKVCQKAEQNAQELCDKSLGR